MNSEEMMLHAISLIGKSRALSFNLETRQKALPLLKDGVKLMNKAIAIDPENIENRKNRLRHLLGITMKSPKNYIIFVKDDIKFFEDHIDQLNLEDKSFFLSALGEYEIYVGHRERGIEILKEVVENYSGTTIHHYTQAYLEQILVDE